MIKWLEYRGPASLCTRTEFTFKDFFASMPKWRPVSAAMLHHSRLMQAGEHKRKAAAQPASVITPGGSLSSSSAVAPPRSPLTAS